MIDCAPYCRRERSEGYTILETLAACTITAILLSLALPSFAELIEKTRIQSQVSLLHVTLHSARNHAISTQSIVIVCAADPRQDDKCSGNYSSNTNWRHGWVVYEDKNRNNHLDTKDTVLNVSGKTNATVVFNQRGRLRFFPDGSARSAGFYVCSTSSKQSWHIKLLHTGRARAQRNLGEKQHKTCLSKA